MADTLAKEMLQRQLARLPRPDEKGRLLSQVREDLIGKLDCRIAHRDCAFADRRFGPDAFPHVERRLHEPVQDRPHRVRFLREGERFL